MLSKAFTFGLLKLASLTRSHVDLESVTHVAVIDDSDTWTEQDQLDLAAFSMQYAATALFKDEDITE